MTARPGRPASPDPARPLPAGLDPLFAGETDIDQLGRIIARLGSPDGAAWPGAAALPDYGKLRFAPAPPRPLAEALPDAPAAAVDLLGRLLRWDPGAHPELTLALSGAGCSSLLSRRATSAGCMWPGRSARTCAGCPSSGHRCARTHSLGGRLCFCAPARPALSAGGARHCARACSRTANRHHACACSSIAGRAVGAVGEPHLRGGRHARDRRGRAAPRVVPAGAAARAARGRRGGRGGRGAAAGRAPRRAARRGGGLAGDVRPLLTALLRQDWALACTGAALPSLLRPRKVLE